MGVKWPVGVVLACACLVGVAHAEKAESLTPEQQVTKAQDTLGELDALLRGAVAKKEQAEADGNILATTCINDQISAIRGLFKHANEQTKALKEAIKQADLDKRTHAFNVITVIGRRAQSFGVEVETCIGDEDSYTGGTERNLTIDPDIRKDDPEDIGPNDDWIDPDGILESGPEGAVRPPNLSGSE